MASITPVGVRLVVQNFGQFTIQMNSVGAALARLGGLGSAVSAGFSLMNAAMRVAMTVAGATVAAIAGVSFAIGKLTASAVNDANDFESAYAGMLKTVAELTDPATNQINELGETVKQQFRDMAKAIPVPFEELARIGTVAGQMDIPASALAGFTKNMAAISVSTDLTADEATENFATIAKIFQISEKDIVNWSSQFGSALVQLGNNFAVNEPKILAFAERIAGAGAALGLTERDIIAIGAAFGQSGVQMQRGGTAVQKVLIKMNEAMQDGGKSLKQIADVAMPGMTDSVEQFLKLDPAEQFRRFTEGLARQGPEAIQVLKELELGDQRLLGAFLNVSSAQGELTRAMRASEDAFWTNTALTREASIFYGTFANQVEITKNKIRDLKVTLGEEIKEHFLTPIITEAGSFVDRIAPELEKAIAKIGPALETYLLPSLGELFTAIFGEVDWDNFGESLGTAIADKIQEFSEDVSAFAQWITDTKQDIEELRETINLLKQDIEGLSSAVSEGGFAGGLEWFGVDPEQAESISKWTEGILIFLGTIGAIIGGIALIEGILVVIAAIPTIITGAITAIAALGGAIATVAAVIASPIVLIVAGIAAIVAILVTNWETISTAFVQAWFIIKYYAKQIWESIKEFFTVKIPEEFAKFKEKVAEAWDGLKEGAVEAWENLKEAVGTAIENLKTYIQEKISALGEILGTVWDNFLEWLGVDEEIKEQWRQIFEDLQLIAEEIWTRISEAAIEKWEEIKGFLIEKWEEISEAFSLAWESVKETATLVWEEVSSAFIEAWETIKLALITKWEEIKTKASEIWESIKAKVLEIWQSITEPIANVWEEIKTTASEAWEALKEAFETAKTNFLDAVANFKQQVIDKWSSIIEDMKKVGANIIAGILKGLNEGRHKIIKWITNLAADLLSTVKAKLDMKSPSQEFYRIGSHMIEGWLRGVAFKEERLKKKMRDTARELPVIASKTYNNQNTKVDRSRRVTVNANYAETQTPGTIADDLATLSLYGF